MTCLFALPVRSLSGAFLVGPFLNFFLLFLPQASKSVYSCPLYMYPVRTGTRERPSFMVFVDLKAGAVDSDHWVKRGTALLLALAT